MKFNLSHILTDPRKQHGMMGYQDVIETVRWGLTELGHDVTVKMNFVAGDRINILFGFQVMREAELKAIPRNSIIYNFEQIAQMPPEMLPPIVHLAARTLRIWDYSPANIETWKKMQLKFPPVLVPVGWSPTISRITPAAVQDIDVLFYGLPSPARTKVMSELSNAGVKLLYASGIYGSTRDGLISRAKLVLNINRQETKRVFEIVRVSYLLANGKAVVSDVYPESIIEPDMREAVAFADLDQVAQRCIQLLGDEPSRKRLEERAPEVMRARDIRQILQTALLQTGT
jgi:hypothetical protein